MQFSMIVILTQLCLYLVQTAPQFPIYNPYPQQQYYNPYLANYGYNQPYYFPSYNSYPFIYQQPSKSLANNQVGGVDIIDVDDGNSATNDQMQNWLKNYQNIQQYNQEYLNNQPKKNVKDVEEQLERKQIEEAAKQTSEIVTANPSEANNHNAQQIIRLADGTGYVFKQVGQSFHETFTSKPIVHTFTETKPIVSHIHRVFTGDGKQPIIKVFYNGKDITNDQDSVDAMHNKKSTTEGYYTGVSTTTEEDSDASDEDDDDDNSPPKPITSWFG